MSNRILLGLFAALLASSIGCGGTNDEKNFFPTPTQGPPTPTPLPICRGIPVPPGLGCRPFTWNQPTTSTTSGTQLFSTLPIPSGGFNFLPSLLGNGIDPGGAFDELPPGMALIAGVPDADGVASVTFAVAEENQLEPGFLIIGVKPILDYICLKIELATIEGTLYCDGTEEGLDTRITAAAGITPSEDDVIELGLGGPSPPGSAFFKVVQQQGRISQGSDPRYETCFTLPECGPGERFDCYRPAQEVGFTTTTVFGMKGDTPLLNADGGEGISGEPFNCADWTTVDGPGQLAQGLVDFDTAGGNVATALRIDD